MRLKAQGRRQKYGAVPTEIEGIRFASKREAKRYMELTLLEKAGDIRNLILQPSFVLECPRGDGAERAVVGIYRADFEFEESDRGYGGVKWTRVVEDAKGFRQPLYIWKKRHVEAQYGITIREV